MFKNFFSICLYSCLKINKNSRYPSNKKYTTHKICSIIFIGSKRRELKGVKSNSVRINWIIIRINNRLRTSCIFII